MTSARDYGLEDSNAFADDAIYVDDLPPYPADSDKNKTINRIIYTITPSNAGTGHLTDKEILTIHNELEKTDVLPA